MTVATTSIERLDAADAPEEQRSPLGRRIWDKTWPPLAAVGLALGVWQLVYLSDWRPDYSFPSPATALSTLGERLADGTYWEPLGVTLLRAAVGFGLSLVIGSLLGLAVARFKTLRAAVGSMITGLQTMPSIAWFPLAIVLFQLSEQAILFVVILGAAPSIANGIISGVDDLPPSLVRAGTVLGARGLSLYRYVIVPAALPTYLGGLKQGWAFAWRSLMAGEIIATVPGHASLGQLLQNDREYFDIPALIATMIVILVVGMVIDALFGLITNGVRRRRGLGALRI